METKHPIKHNKLSSCVILLRLQEITESKVFYLGKSRNESNS